MRGIRRRSAVVEVVGVRFKGLLPGTGPVQSTCTAAAFSENLGSAAAVIITTIIIIITGLFTGGNGGGWPWWITTRVTNLLSRSAARIYIYIFFYILLYYACVCVCVNLFRWISPTLQTSPPRRCRLIANAATSGLNIMCTRGPCDVAAPVHNASFAQNNTLLLL